MNLPTPPKPRKAEIASVVKHLRFEALQQRSYAKGDIERALTSRVPDFLAKSAKQHETKATRFERVAQYLEDKANDA